MRLRICVLTALWTLGFAAAAQQPPPPVEPAACASEVADLTHEVEAARTKGQMLRRQQLANELAALRARCDATPHAAEPGRAADVHRLEQRIKELRAELDRAEEELRKLKTGAM